jgi:hypothetical protein
LARSFSQECPMSWVRDNVVAGVHFHM